MKKTISAIKIHSFVSVITNSSTELFVCKTKKKIKAVKEILQKILDGYNIINDSSYGMDVFDEPWVFSVKKYREWVKEEKVIRAECDETKDWSKLWEHENHIRYGSIQGWFHDDESPEEMEEMRKHVIEYGERVNLFFGCSTTTDSPYRNRIWEAAKGKDGKHDFDAEKKELEKIYKEIEAKKDKPTWWDEPWKHQWTDALVKDLDGCVIICGSGDNSIPYDIWDFINSKLNGRNYHLG